MTGIGTHSDATDAQFDCGEVSSSGNPACSSNYRRLMLPDFPANRTNTQINIRTQQKQN